ncbi:MAG: DUF1565 domain-containing protein [Polyangiaceae bacterium]|nr:DUF1565 domain-containing protein [Polyangiaceae bacterium]
MGTRGAAALGAAMLATWGAVAVAGCWPFVADHCELRCVSGATSTGAGGGGGAGGAADLFVDPVAGHDDWPGTEEAPLKTLKRALTLAAGGATVHLFGGTYDAASGEDFAAPIGDGVTIAAIAPGEAILSGAGVETALFFEGSGAAEGLRIEGFAVGVAAQAGAVALEAVELAGNATAVSLTGAAEVAMMAGVIRDGAAGAWLFDDASLTMTGGEIRGIGEVCGALAAWVDGAALLDLDGTLVQDSLGVLLVSGSAHARITGGALSAVGCGTAIHVADVAGLELQDTAVTQGGGAGAVITAEEQAEVSLVGGVVLAADRAVEGASYVWLDGVAITGGPGADRAVIPGASGVAWVNNAAIHGFAVGLDVASGQALIRGSDLSDNGIGVRTANAFIDMGTEADPGGNTLIGSAQAGLFVSAGSAWLHEAVGNTWIASNQGTDANGQFPPGTAVVGPFGTSGAAPHNVVIQTAGAGVRLAAP